MLGLRPYKPCDAEAVVSWAEDERTLRMWTADRFKDDAWPLPAERFNAYYRQFDGEDNVFPMTAFDECGIPAGHLFLRYTGPDTVRIGFVIADPKRRGRGEGREMIALAVEYARRFLLAKTVTLGVFADNPAALRCYTAAGFRPVGEAVFSIAGEDWTGVEMALPTDE